LTNPTNISSYKLKNIGYISSYGLIFYTLWSRLKSNKNFESGDSWSM